jgi:uncharacterized membrane protein
MTVGADAPSGGGTAMNEPGGFAVQHKWDRSFFLAFVTVGWLVVIAGFTGELVKRAHGNVDYPAPPILVVHIAAFVAWMLVLSAQVTLVRVKRHRVHRSLGMVGFALVPIMVVSALGAEVYSQHFYSPQFAANLNFFIAPLLELVMFTGCAVAAFLVRRSPAAHKRLVVVATSLILVAAFNRWWGEGIYNALGDGYLGMFARTYLGPDLLIACAMAYDLITRRRIHTVYRISVPLILALELLTTLIYHHPAWPGVARWMLGM